MTALIKYEAARYALKIAQQVDEVKDIRDKAQALAAYARQAKDPDLINWATEIKLRAERRAGELLTETERNKGAAGNAVTRGDRVPKTLEEIGISKNQSSKFQALAEIPEEKFEEEVKSGRATTASLVRESPKRKKSAEAKALKPRKAKPPAESCAKCAKLQEALDESDEKREILADELKTMEVLSGDAKKAKVEMQTLREELRSCTRSRNEAMARCKEMEKQIAWWRKQAEKLGWKPKDK